MNIRKQRYTWVLLVLTMMLVGRLHGQVRYVAENAKVKVLGTSTLHDWSLVSDKGVCKATFALQGTDQLKALQSLSFTVLVKTLQSEHGGLAKNAYEALNAEKYSQIEFLMTSADAIVAQKDGSYKVTCKGDLTVAGVSKPITLEAECKMGADKSIACTGFYLMRMTSHNVRPPKMMLGTIKTGDDIHVDFVVNLKP